MAVRSVKIVRPRENACFVRFGARPAAQLRLFCFVWSGGSASAFRSWAEALPTDIEAVGIELPGHGNRRDEPACDRLQPTARQIVEAVCEELNDRPGRFALFGHSYGSLLSYEVARLLEAEGRQSELVVLSGSRAPATPPEIVLHRLSDRGLLGKLRQMGGMSEIRLRDAEFLRTFLPLVRTDLTACETYRPVVTASLRAPVSAWAGNDDWYAPPRSVKKWRELAGPAFRLRVFPGGHFFTQDRNAVLSALFADLTWGQTQAARASAERVANVIPISERARGGSYRERLPVPTGGEPVAC